MRSLMHLIENKTLTLSLVFIFLTLSSIISWFKIPVEVLPKENTPPFLYLRVNATEPRPIEQLEFVLTKPVEGVIKTISNLIQIQSTTDASGTSVSISLKPKTNLDLTSIQIMEGLTDLENNGVLDLRNVTISRLNPDASSIIKLTVTSQLDPVQTRQLLNDRLRVYLESMPAVAKIEYVGLEAPQIRYNLRYDRLNALGLDPMDAKANIQGRDLRESLGFSQNNEISTSVQIRLNNLDLKKIESLNLTKSTAYRLQDVANRNIYERFKNEIVHKNSENTVFIEVYAKEGANLFELRDQINSFLQNPSAEFKDLGFEVLFNKTEDLKNSLQDVFNSLYQAMLITFIIVLLFLKDLRQTLVVNLSIPLTLLVTVLIMYISGSTLNILSLSGLILGIGMVVDNALLVVENNQDFLNKGMAIKQSAAKAIQVVAIALVLSTVTNALIFMPVAFVPDGDAFIDLLKSFQTPLLSSLAASIVVALLLMPILSFIFLRKKNINTNVAESQLHSSLTGQGAAYSFFLSVQKYSKWLVVAATIVLCVVFNFVSDIESTDMDVPKDPFWQVSIQFDGSIAVANRMKYFNQIESQLVVQKDNLNLKFILGEFNPQTTKATLTLYPVVVKDVDSDLIKAQAKTQSFIEQQSWPVGVNVVSGSSYAQPSKSGSRKYFNFEGPSMVGLNSELDKITMNIEKMPGIERVLTEKEISGNKELFLIPKPEAMQNKNFDMSVIANYISAILTGISIQNVSWNGEKLGLKVDYNDFKKMTLEEVLKIAVPVGKVNGLVTKVTIGSLFMTEWRSVPGVLLRKKGLSQSKLVVYASNYAALTEVERFIHAHVFPTGYGIAIEDSFARIEAMQKNTVFVVGLSVFLIYIVLGMSFESFLIPISVLVSIPLAVLFGVFGLKIFGFDLDVMARLALIILVGIGVNNAIILIDLILQLQKKGFSRKEAIAYGCAERLKAVVMTTAIQVISVFPVALGQSKIMGIPYASLGVAIISGMLFSTIVTLILLPLTYDVLDRLELFLRPKESSISG